jgi:hypothetical protein
MRITGDTILKHIITDSASLQFMHMIRDRAAYREAIEKIKSVLDDPQHGAYHSDVWAMVWGVIHELEERNQ